MTERDRKLSERLQFLVDKETKDRVDNLPKGTEYGGILRAFLRAYLDGNASVDENGNIHLSGSPKTPLVKAPTDARLVQAFADALDRPRNEREKALKIILADLLSDRLKK